MRRSHEQNAPSVAERGKEEHLPALIDNPSATEKGWIPEPQISDRADAWNDSACPGYEAQRASRKDVQPGVSDAISVVIGAERGGKTHISALV